MTRANGADAWWTAAWTAVLEEAGPSGTRSIQRGQALFRRGAVEDLALDAGEITGRVRENRGELARVSLAWPLPPPDAWRDVVDRLAGEVRFSAALLDGLLPDGLDATMAELGLRIIPRFDDLTLRCSCRERNEVCRHVAAVHAAAGALIGRDPFGLFRLRGKSRDELLSEVRAMRGEPDGDLAIGGLDVSRGLTVAQGDLDAIPLHPEHAADPAALYRHLGPPPGVEDEEPIARLIERAAAAAWRLAAGDGAEAADEELLLAELRAQKVASPSSLASALGRDADGIREELDRLFSEGAVMRTGSGERARYRAAARAPSST